MLVDWRVDLTHTLELVCLRKKAGVEQVRRENRCDSEERKTKNQEACEGW